MIDSISGDVVRIGPDYLVIDTGGIAYQAFCSTETLRSVREGHPALIHIHLIVRDDTIQLYGFETQEERELFRQLLSVGQVGPRLALQLLSALPPESFIEAITDRDVRRLTSVKGIGRKTAERILVDLRDKVGTSITGSGARFFLSREEETALQALTSRALGFSPQEAHEALHRVREEGLSADELVRRALEVLGSRR